MINLNKNKQTEQTESFNQKYYNNWLNIMNHPDIKYFNWGIMYDCQYATIDPIYITKKYKQKIDVATEACERIYRKVVKIALENDNIMQLLGYPIEILDYCRHNYNPEKPVTLIGRFDFHVNDNEIKMLEFNSDTPTGFCEASELQSLISKLYNSDNPNIDIFNNTKEAFKIFIDDINNKNIVFTSLGWHDEDKNTMLAELDYSKIKGKYIPLDKLKVDNYLYDNIGNKIDVLYRLYPIEWLMREDDGWKLIRMITNNKLQILNPPSAFVAQSKGMQTLIWELRKTNKFTNEEKDIIDTYFLPTYLSNYEFIGKPYVAKPFFGREGGGVYLYDKCGKSDVYASYEEYEDMMVFQERINLPLQTIKTWSGDYTGHLLVGSFIIGGKASGLLMRIGEEITGNLSCYAPILYK